jgi:hypothetical protein
MTETPGLSAGPDGLSPHGPVSGAVRFWRLLLGAGGLALMGYGASGLFDEPAYLDKRGVGKWLLGGLLAHDAAFAIIVFTVGWLTMRLLPGRGPAPWVRRTLLGGLAAGTAATLIALPALLRPGAPANSSTLVQDYPRNLAITWGIVAAATGIVVTVRKRRMRSGGSRGGVEE